ncbi:MAG: hypothetical protein U9P50_01810 [Patescibacteria group bacterium]|nr:hypothetical protein [Patescibacteria group bacterium]
MSIEKMNTALDGNNQEKNLDEIPKVKYDLSGVEAEVGNLKDAVIQLLGKQDRYKLAKDVEEGKISLGLHEQKFLNMGEIAEKETIRKGEEFDSTNFLLKRAQIIVDELVN